MEPETKMFIFFGIVLVIVVVMMFNGMITQGDVDVSYGIM